MLTMVAVATSCVSIGNHSKQYCCPTDSTRQNQVICSIWSSYSIHFLLATPSHPKSVPWTQKMMLTHCGAATLGFNVCRGTRITETKRTAITGHPHNPSIHIYIYVRVKTRQYIGSSLMTYTFDIAAKLHIQLYAYNSGIVGANRWRKCPLP